MLALKNIIKDYPVGDEVVHALKGVDLSFRESEFVAILGQSGCGKTTLLNIIGGLDRYTDGDLVINGRSTKEYSAKDWDAYRNHSIGFVFQSYNLIPHQTVLKNVELALTLSGVSKSERRKRAIEVLEKVGLGDQLNKKPTQMSGGQMQRVAIARAMVNDPDILLADEPTGALDTQTSIQIMDLLKEISKTKLVIMVTHNPELAEQYATRIVRLLDGKITSDTQPVTKAEEKEIGKKANHTSMSLFTALSLSLNNLLTKKTRTILTAFAGSIGIIGIALILSLSNGVHEYINKVQEETLSTYPLMIQQQTADSSSMLTAILGIQSEDENQHEPDRIYSSNVMGEILNTMMSEIKINDLASFKAFLDANDEVQDLVTDIKYTYTVEPNIFMDNPAANGVTMLNPSTIMTSMFSAMGVSDGSLSELSSLGSMYGGSSAMSVWTEMIDNEELLRSQYTLLTGKWPEAFNEVLLIVDSRNELSDFALYSLGLKDPSEVEGQIRKMMLGEQIVSEKVSFSYEDLLNLKFRLVLPADYYQLDAAGKWNNMSDDAAYMTTLLNSDRAVSLNVVGIIKPDEEAVATSLNGAIAYTKELTEYIVRESGNCEIVKQQLAHPETDVLTGLPFEAPKEPTVAEIRQALTAQFQMMSEEERQQTEGMFMTMITEDTTGAFADLQALLMSGQEISAVDMISYLPDEFIIQIYKQSNPPQTTKNTYETNLMLLGYSKLEEPFMISIFPKDFASKDRLSEIISDYNKSQPEEKKIEYTDYIELLMSSVSTIINAITYILIAFVAISLVVSSIMIGIITYISVLERTKEIGILRSIGASKRDISRVFNAETMIIGFVSGALGILVTVLLNIPINIIIKHYTDISGLSKLPIIGAIALILISVALTLIAGLIPSRIAAKKDPVTALRSE